MSKNFPYVVRWDSFPRDVTEPVRLFETSLFNYFYNDHKSGVTMGYWEVENGGEYVGDSQHPRDTDEVIVVLEGKLFVSGSDEKEQEADPGDIVMVLHGRETRIRAEERTRAFFLLWNADTEEIQARMRGEGDLSQLPQPLQSR